MVLYINGAKLTIEQLEYEIRQSGNSYRQFPKFLKELYASAITSKPNRKGIAKVEVIIL